MTDYAVVVLCQMVRDTRQAVFTASCLAEATGLPLPTVSKVLKTLANKGIVTAHRGAAGGYGLARAAESISARDIVVALEGPVVLTACVEPGDMACDFEESCPIRGNWGPVNAAIYDALSKVSLADMALPRAPYWGMPTKVSPRTIDAGNVDTEGARAHPLA
jgi:FeS assembly SUF system regulator